MSYHRKLSDHGPIDVCLFNETVPVHKSLRGRADMQISGAVYYSERLGKVRYCSSSISDPVRAGIRH